MQTPSTHPAPPLPPPYAAALAASLPLHLGSTTQPAPFGGRTAELAALDQWLADERAPHFCLLTGAPSSGKTALLTQWMRTHADDETVRALYLPLDLLSGTFWAVLGLHLATCFDETPTWHAHTEAEWRTLCQLYLQRTPTTFRTLLIVLDGLDLADHPALTAADLPTTTDPAVRLLVSQNAHTDLKAAQKLGLAHLNWTSAKSALRLTLDALDSEAVSAVFVGYASTVAADMWRLSQGDPLVVRLYADALAQGLFAPTDLPSVDTGLVGYIQHWENTFNSQGKRRDADAQALMREFLTLLACADGPLYQSDIAALLPDSPLRAPARVAALAARAPFVTGDGKTRGYAFTNARTAQLCYNTATPDARAEYRAKLHAYCQAVFTALVDGQLAPAKVPAYVLHHYAAFHAEASAYDCDTLRALLCPAWHTAWETQVGGSAGLRRDIGLIWQIADAAHDYALAAECAVWHARTLTAGSIPLELLSTAFEQHTLTPTQTLALAACLPSEDERTTALIHLSPLMPDALTPALCQLAATLPALPARCQALTALAERMPAHYVELTLETARALPDSREQMDALNALAPYLAPRHLRTATEIAATIPVPAARAYTLGLLAIHQPARQQRAAFQAAFDAASAVTDPEARVEALTMLALHAPADLRVACGQAALPASALIPSADARINALLVISLHLPDAQQTDCMQTAVTLLDEIDPSEYADTLATLAPHLPDALLASTFTRALAHDLLNSNPAEMCTVLSAFAPHLPAQSPQGETLLDQAFAALCALEIPYYFARALNGLARRLTPAQLQKALEITRTIDDEYACLYATLALAGQLPADEALPLWRTALKLVPGVNDPDERFGLLRTLARRLPDPHKTQALREAFDLVWLTPDPTARGEALAALRPSLPDTLVRAALAKIRAEGDPLMQLSTGTAFSDLLPSAQHTLSITRALAATRTPAALAQLPAIVTECIRAMPTDALPTLLPTISALPDPDQRAEALSTLVSAMAPTQTHAIFAQLIADADVETLKQIGQYLPESLVRPAFKFTRALANTEDRNQMLNNLATHLPDDLLLATFKLLRQDKSGEAVASFLSYVSERVRGALLKEVFTIISKMQFPQNQVSALNALAHGLSERDVRTALKLARTIRPAYMHIEALANLAQRLPKAQQIRVWREALKSAQAIADDAERASALGALSTANPPRTLHADLLAALDTLPDAEARSTALINLIPTLTAAHARRVVKQLTRGLDDFQRTTLITQNAAAFQNHAAQAVFDLATTFTDPAARVATFNVMLYQHEVLRTEANLRTAFAAAPALRHPDQAHQLADYLDTLGPYLPDDLLPNALQLVPTIVGRDDQIYAFNALAVRLSGKALTRALALARAFPDPADRVHGLYRCADATTNAAQTRRIMEEALTFALTITDSEKRGEVFLNLVEALSETALVTLIEPVRAHHDPAVRARALGKIAMRGPATHAATLWSEALATASALSDPEQRRDVLNTLDADFFDWVPVSPATARPIWLATLHQCAAHGYANLVNDLYALCLSMFMLVRTDAAEGEGDAALAHFSTRLCHALLNIAN